MSSPWGKLIVVVLVLRLGLIGLVLQDSERGILIDSRAYITLASLLNTEGHYRHSSRQDLIWPPGYPAFIYAASGFTDPNPLTVGLVQIMITGLASLVLFKIGAEAGSVGAGLLAAFLNAISPNTGLWSLTIMSETLFGFLIVLGVLSWLLYASREQPIWIAVSGFALGLGALVRPIGIYLLVIWFLITLAWDRRARGLTAALARSFILVGAAGFVILPWVVRNWQVHGEPVFSRVGEKTLYAFNLATVLAAAEGTTRDQATGRIGGEDSEFQDVLEVIRKYPGQFAKQQALGVLRSTVGVESGVWARLFGYGIERQGGFGVLTGLLKGQFASSFDLLWSTFRDPRTFLLMALTVTAILYSLTLWSLSLFSLGWAHGQGRLAIYLVLLIGLTSIYLLLIPGAAGQARFRIPAEPLIAMLAGFGGIQLWARVKRPKIGIEIPTVVTGDD